MATPTRDLIVVGTSAGGVEALRTLVAGLPEDLPAAVMVVLHLPAGGTSALPAILGRAGSLPTHSARSGAAVERGCVYVAPPDHHLLVDDGRMVLSRGPAENGHRPAINALFRSAALAAGPRVIGVVMSGNLDDGAAGLAAIVRRGGRALVQDPDDALYPSMPEAALRQVRAQAVLPANQMGKHLSEAVRQPIAEGDVEQPPDEALRYEVAVARSGDPAVRTAAKALGAETEFSCPDCGGSLIDVSGSGTGYRCHVGHGWTLDALHNAKQAGVEQALWTALRTLEEKAVLSKRLEAGAAERGYARLGDRHHRDYREATAAAAVLRQLLIERREPAQREPSVVGGDS